MRRVTLIPGDGIGPEVIEASKLVIDATGVDIEWEELKIGEEALPEYGSLLPKEVLDSIRRNKVALKGPVTTPVGRGFRSVNVALRRELELYACVRPIRSMGAPSRYENIDLIVIRENTEDLYVGVEFKAGSPEALRFTEFGIREDSGISIKAISASASRRVSEFAFKLAEREGRRKVTAVHKANILKETDGLFLDVAREVSKEHPRIEFEDMVIDNFCMQVVRDPSRFDVLVLPNLYGDIVSELISGMCGGIGIVPSANIGDEHAVFEPAHGSAPKYKGKNKVNPIGAILAGAMMLKHIGEEGASRAIEESVGEVIREGEVLTYDLGGNSGTREVAEEIAKKVRGMRWRN